MTAKQRWLMLGGGLGLYLAALGFLGKLAAELAELDYRRAVMAVQGAPAERDADAAPWNRYLWRAEEALTHGNRSAAELALHAAYAAALRSPRWDGLVDVGTAYLRIGEAAPTRKPSEARARQLYLAALFRARQQDSLDGVLRATEAFAALGDREVVEQGLRVAEAMAARPPDPEGRERVRAAAERLAARPVGQTGYGLD